MARFNLVKIGGIYLTSTGLQSGTACKLTVAGLDALAMDKTGTVTAAADGTPFVELVDVDRRGSRVVITIESLAQSVFNDLKDLLNDAVNDGDVLTLEISGKTGNFNLSVLPLIPKPLSFGAFNNFWIKNTVISLITA